MCILAQVEPELSVHVNLNNSCQQLRLGLTHVQLTTFENIVEKGEIYHYCFKFIKSYIVQSLFRIRCFWERVNGGYALAV